MIAVLVGDEHSIELFRHHTQTGEAPCKLARREATVDQQARTPRLDQQGVTLAAAAQRGETDHRYFS